MSGVRVASMDSEFTRDHPQEHRMTPAQPRDRPMVETRIEFEGRRDQSGKSELETVTRPCSRPERRMGRRHHGQQSQSRDEKNEQNERRLGNPLRRA